MTAFPGSHWQTIDECLLKDTYDSDQAMYPAPELTYDRLKSWVDACPELCLCLQCGQTKLDHAQLKKFATDGVHGLIIVLPLLLTYWERLVNGEVEEHDIDASEMFPLSSPAQPQTDGDSKRDQVGLHVFHIERYLGFSTTLYGATFTSLALEEIRRRVQKAFRSWEVVGFSALTATDQGNAAFKRLGFTRPASASGSKLLHEAAEMVERKGNEAFTPSRIPAA